MSLLELHRIPNALSIGKLSKSKVTSVEDSSWDGNLLGICWLLDIHFVRQNFPSLSTPVTSFDTFIIVGRRILTPPPLLYEDPPPPPSTAFFELFGNFFAGILTF